MPKNNIYNYYDEFEPVASPLDALMVACEIYDQNVGKLIPVDIDDKDDSISYEIPSTDLCEQTLKLEGVAGQIINDLGRFALEFGTIGQDLSFEKESFRVGLVHGFRVLQESHLESQHIAHTIQSFTNTGDDFLIRKEVFIGFLENPEVVESEPSWPEQPLDGVKDDEYYAGFKSMMAVGLTMLIDNDLSAEAELTKLYIENSADVIKKQNKNYYSLHRKLDTKIDASIRIFFKVLSFFNTTGRSK